MDELTERDTEILALERRWWLVGAERRQAIRDRFGVTPARFNQELAGIVELPAALVYDPLLVRRLRRRADLTGIARHPAGRRLG
ncbi:MAG: hypothetical protein QOI82_202 [Actinomycetota bacterium]|jgi:hypothetical protein|nr:hypothetical protein [Actinomycetota bacterium]